MARRPVPSSLLLALVAAAALPASAAASPSGPAEWIVGGLHTPWELAPTPDGRTFVVERGDGSGRAVDVRVLDAADRLLPGVALSGSEIGPDVRKFLGLALHPDFARNHRAYLYVGRATDPDGAGPANGGNEIWRLRDESGRLRPERRVFGGIDSDGNHDGGRMAFGPDGRLYVTTGDIHQPARPRDPGSLNGKILRFAAPGDEQQLTAPSDNPFVARGGAARYVWSLGHRHPQGLAFDAAGRLWESEHGPTGEQHGPLYPGGNGRSGRDELNLIVRGGDYGWPTVSGPDRLAGAIAPVAVAGDQPSWAPGDLAVGADGSLYAPFLRGAELRQFDVRRGAVVAQRSHLAGTLGRLRVAVARGGDLLIAQDDGADAGIYRLPLGPRSAASDAADPPRGGPAARGLARALRDRARRLGRTRLARGARIAVRRGDLPRGRVTVELRLGRASGPRLARTAVAVAVTGRRTIALRPSATARRRLRGTGGRRIVVRVAVRPDGGTVARASATGRLR
ncbi:PQQ-dependent sugar dehydrogenase [Patulibacter defluvii]|uniref:PQQ-dependent sugar dehydrogenase n=1 Tax=Patulibacter defluvii TaxID=3095358 RepID=UPI002A7558D4|nr:PQQ-dependent sugar dehydrogenase [Patulibacter sp. DM4]